MKNTPTQAQINELFDNEDQQVVWAKVNDIIRRMSPDYDFTLIQLVYQDVMRLFHGDYPGYSPIKTLYHDLPHTLEVLLCGVRLMHGVHVSGDRLTDEEISLIVIAILMHDVGYAQRKGEESGTGAQHTQTHVQRGIELVGSPGTTRASTLMPSYLVSKMTRGSTRSSERASGAGDASMGRTRAGSWVQRDGPT